MNEDVNLDEIGKKNPFKVPDGYFEGLTSQIMAQLPEKVQGETKVISLWDRVKPWMYMAAIFMGVALMVKVFTNSREQFSSGGLNLASSADIEEFYQYYEDQLTGDLYHETLYAEENFE
ncbi:MAG: hypothetical protein LBO74_11120 [Candidatus Symbiothrix sp.]|jgi:hypothetical protein|nr:hypothetical protein [Candidatus Symbiothrix sp.]